MYISVWAFLLLFSVKAAVFAVDLKANDGDTVTIPFKTGERGRVDRVNIMFTRLNETQRTLIAQYCSPAEMEMFQCRDVKTPGVSLHVQQGEVTLTLLNVSSSRDTGLYQTQIISSDQVVKEPFARLYVIKSPPSSPPTQTHSPQLPDFNDHWKMGVYILIGIVAIAVVLNFGVTCFSYKSWEDLKQFFRHSPEPPPPPDLQDHFYADHHQL